MSCKGSFNSIWPLKSYICPEQNFAESQNILFTTDVNIAQWTKMQIKVTAAAERYAVKFTASIHSAILITLIFQPNIFII
jgi:hypothetical protein